MYTYGQVVFGPAPNKVFWELISVSLPVPKLKPDNPYSTFHNVSVPPKTQLISAVLDVIFVAFIELGSEHVACTKQDVVANGNGQPEVCVVVELSEQSFPP